MKKKIYKILFTIFLTVLFTELILRFFFYQQLNKSDYVYYNKIQLNDSSVFDSHNSSYKNLSIRITNKDRNVGFNLSYDKYGYRITKPTSIYPQYENLPKVIFLGCSFAVGTNVDDTCVYSYLMQNETKKYNILNAGIAGFGAAMSLFRLKENINKRNNNISTIVYMYGSFHLIRDVENLKWENTFKHNTGILETYKKNKLIDSTKINDRLFIYGKSTVNDSIYLTKKIINIAPGIMKQSYIFRALELIYENIQYKLLLNKMQHTNFRLVNEMNTLCKKNKIRYIVYSVTKGDKPTTLLETFCKENSIEFYYSCVDINNKSYTFSGDNHYNQEGHKLVKEDLLKILKIDN